jgi:hypothetical protein
MPLRDKTSTMKRPKSASGSSLKRGRPAKFGRPSRLVALTLPDDVVTALRSINVDLGWAIVQLAEPLLKGSAFSNEPASDESERLIELAQLPKKRALIVVWDPVLREIPGVTAIPLSDGRSFLAFDGVAGLADLELAVLDRIEALPAEAKGRPALVQIRESVRSWRQDDKLRFTTKSIIVVERVSGPSERTLGRLKVEA